MKTIPIPMVRSGPPADFTLAVRVSAGDTYEWSKVLLARAHFSGTLELLTGAWEKALGYGRNELQGKTLCQLMRSSTTTAADAVAAILDEQNMDAVDLTVCCRAGEAKCLRLHRRLDSYAHKVFIVAEEVLLSASEIEPLVRKACA
jgi:hypothetical protein